MSCQIIDSELTETNNQEEARFVRIEINRFDGCKVTEGKIYKVERNYGNPNFENGEMYVVDDTGKDNYSVFLVCKSTLLK